jgi:hypothetical protein
MSRELARNVPIQERPQSGQYSMKVDLLLVRQMMRMSAGGRSAQSILRTTM